MIFKDYYKILGLDTNKVSMAQIKVAYREQAKKYHPDVNIANKRNEERFKDINEAYKVLSDQTSKRKYDRSWKRNIGYANSSYHREEKARESASAELLNMFFGNFSNKSSSDNKSKEEKENSKSKIKGENIETEVEVTLEDGFRGNEKTVGIRTIDGSLKKFKIKLPVGIQNNEKIRIAGQGKEGKNGGKNGDLFIRVKMKNDSRFKLKGYDLITNLYLTPWEAALSTKVTVTGINEDVLVYIPAGIQSGEKIEIPDRGYRDGKGGRGKLILDTKIMNPKNPTEEEIELYKKLEKISNYNPRESKSTLD